MPLLPVGRTTVRGCTPVHRAPPPTPEPRSERPETKAKRRITSNVIRPTRPPLAENQTPHIFPPGMAPEPLGPWGTPSPCSRTAQHRCRREALFASKLAPTESTCVGRTTVRGCTPVHRAPPPTPGPRSERPEAKANRRITSNVIRPTRRPPLAENQTPPHLPTQAPQRFPKPPRQRALQSSRPIPARSGQARHSPAAGRDHSGSSGTARQPIGTQNNSPAPRRGQT